VNEPKTHKGPGLELRTAAYFQSLGYLVRRGVKLAVAAGSADATDIDVVAIRFGVPLAEERLIADCKDRKKPRPFERVLWTRGLATFARADRSVVVLPRVPWQAREFGAQGGVEIMETKEVSGGAKDGATDSSYGEADPALERVTEVRRQRVHQQDGTLARDLGKEDLKLRQMLIVGHPLTNLNRIIRMLSSVGEGTERGSEDARWLKLCSCYNAAVVASVMLLRFASETKWTPEAEWSDYARKKLTYGDVPPQKARQLAKLALDRDFFEGMPSPEYTEEVVSVIGTLISQPAAAATVPQALDFKLFGQELGSEDSSQTLSNVLHPDSARLGKRVLSALSYAADIPADLWEADENVRGPAVPADSGASPKLR
jgi:hypothetical protein